MEDSSNSGSMVFLILILLGLGFLGYLLVTDQIPDLRLPSFSGIGNPIQGVIDSLAGIGKGLTDVFSGFFK